MVVGASDSAQASEVVCYDRFAISVMIERKAASLWRDRFGGLLSSAGSTETHHPTSAFDSPQVQDCHRTACKLSMSGLLHGEVVAST